MSAVFGTAGGDGHRAPAGTTAIFPRHVHAKGRGILPCPLCGREMGAGLCCARRSVGPSGLESHRYL